MHIPPHENNNKPIIDAHHASVPLTYFNIVKLSKGESFTYAVANYETCIVPATGCIDIIVTDVATKDHHYEKIGNRGRDVWDGEPEAVYLPTGMTAHLTCQSDNAEIFIAGAQFN